MLQARLLGQSEILSDGIRLEIPTRNAQALLAYLLLTAGQTHRRERLAGLLWPDSAEENARSNLRHELWRLRKALGDAGQGIIASDDLTVALKPDSDYWLDVAQFESASVTVASADELIASLSAYGGELLPGFYQEWVFAERERLHAAYETRIARLLELLQAGDRWHDVQTWATRWIAAGEWPEAAYRALMLSHVAAGDLPRAVATYERFRDQIAGEFGIQPSEQTRQLYERLKAGEPVVPAAPPVEVPGVPDPVSATAVPVQAAVSNNLPRPLTSFIGRRKEIAQVKTLVDEARLVTVVGPGGVGKTRLAIAAGGEVAPRFEHGTWWAELAPLAAGAMAAEELVLQAIAKALQLPETSGDSLHADVNEHLRQRTLLLILDNCEHLISACAVVAESLLTEHDGLSILATSREPLRIAGEQIWELASLSLPPSAGMADSDLILEAEAVQLFLQRARISRPEFRPQPDDLLAVARICQRLDGLPLAIELAAARINLLSPKEIADRLDSRFSLLTGGQRTALLRHQTLRATIEWSYDLLSETEQVLFRRISVFAVNFTLQAVEAVCSGPGIPAEDILGLLGRLRDKSLLHIDSVSHEGIGGTRYRLLDSICAFGRLKLDEVGETQQFRNRHAAYYQWVIESAEPELWLERAPMWSRLLTVEYDNIRSAIDWSIESDQAEYGARIVTVLSWFWFAFHSMRESIDLAQKILALPSAAAPASFRARLLNTMSYLQCLLGEMTGVRSQMEEALVILGTDDNESPEGRAWALQLQALVLSYEGHHEEAGRAMETSLELAGTEQVHRSSSLGVALWGDIVVQTGDLSRAVQVYEDAANLLRTLNNNFAAYPLRRLGYLALARNEYDAAWRYFSESLTINRGAGDRRGRIANLVSLATLALRLDQPDVAARLMGTIERHMEALANLMALDQAQLELVRKQVRSLSAAHRLVAEMDAGRAMSEDQLMALIESAFADDLSIVGAGRYSMSL